MEEKNKERFPIIMKRVEKMEKPLVERLEESKEGASPTTPGGKGSRVNDRYLHGVSGRWCRYRGAGGRAESKSLFVHRRTPGQARRR